MVRDKFKYFASFLVLIACLALSNISRAANLMTTDGVAVITSKIDKKLFRTRAIENALQNLVSQGSQTVDSFSIIENGKVLLDQVHLASKLGIQEYSVIREEIKGKFYHVSLNVVVNDNQDKEINENCRRAGPPSMDLYVNIEIEKNKLPPWAVFTEGFIHRAIENHEFAPSLKSPSSHNERQIKATELYSVYKKDNAKTLPKNYYKLHATIVVEAVHNNKFLEKNLDLKVTVSSHILRKEEKILEKNIANHFPIIQKNLNGLLNPVSRKDWPATKKNITNFILENLDRQLTDLDCLNFYPKIYAEAGHAYVDYGSLDGILPSDMFLLKNSNAKKIYFQLESLGEHNTKIKLISKIEALEELIGSEVEVVSGS